MQKDLSVPHRQRADTDGVTRRDQPFFAAVVQNHGELGIQMIEHIPVSYTHLTHPWFVLLLLLRLIVALYNVLDYYTPCSTSKGEKSVNFN